MHTIASLRKALGLQTTHQVRNRIDAIKDVLSDSLRRGPNNQILLTDDGLARLQELQGLYDSGLTMTEASDVMRAKVYKKELPRQSVSHDMVRNETKEAALNRQSLDRIRNELTSLRERIARLEGLRAAELEKGGTGAPAWWERLRGESDAA